MRAFGCKLAAHASDETTSHRLEPHYVTCSSRHTDARQPWQQYGRASARARERERDWEVVARGSPNGPKRGTGVRGWGYGWEAHTQGWGLVRHSLPPPPPPPLVNEFTQIQTRAAPRSASTSQQSGAWSARARASAATPACRPRGWRPAHGGATCSWYQGHPLPRWTPRRGGCAG